tara:strand:+ start:297 stop:608 length:312 start_codon:yes stop_codon:yes gene_type:complete
MTKVEDRIESVEKWIANFQEGNEESLVFSNMNFLVAQLKAMGDRLTQVEQSHIQLQNAIEANNKVFGDFVGDNELEDKWQKFLKDLQEDANATEEGEDTEDDK